MIINCSEIVERIKGNIKKQIEELKANKITSKLVIVRIEGDEASEVYVRSKIKRCEETGIESEIILLPTTVTENEVLEVINNLNNDKTVHGILVQLPIPKHINEHKIINAINPLKDVDCLTEINIGKLFSGQPYTIPCTPKGIMTIFKEMNIDLKTKDVVIINRSMLVGKPLLQLLQQENATVTLAHSKTKTTSLFELMKKADIIITATGNLNFINKNILGYIESNKKKIIIDVSMNRNENNKLCGDIDKQLYTDDYYKEKFLNSFDITPVPKGVGLTTVISLLENTIICVKKLNNIK